MPYSGLTGPLPRDPTTGALLVTGVQAELGRAEITSNATGTSNVFSDVAGLSVTLTTDGNPVELEAFCPFATNAQAGADFAWQILVDGVVVQVGTVTAPAAGKGAATIMKAVVSLAAGSHTFKIQARSNVNGQAWTMWSFATGPSYIAVKRK